MPKKKITGYRRCPECEGSGVRTGANWSAIDAYRGDNVDVELAGVKCWTCKGAGKIPVFGDQAAPGDGA